MSQFFSLGLFEFCDLGARLVAHHTATPVLSDFVESLVEVGLHNIDQVGQRSLVFGVDCREGECGDGLESGHLTKTGSATSDNAIWDTHLSAQAGQMENNLNWVAIGSNANKSGLLLLDSGGHGIGANFNNSRALAWGSLLAVGLSLSLGSQTLVLGLLRLGTVFVQKTEQIGSGLAIEKVATELVDGWWHLESLVKDRTTALDADITWPFEEAGKIALWLDVATDREVLRLLLNQWVHHLFVLLSLGRDGSREGSGLLLDNLLLNHDEAWIQLG